MTAFEIAVLTLLSIIIVIQIVWWITNAIGGKVFLDKLQNRYDKIVKMIKDQSEERTEDANRARARGNQFNDSLRKVIDQNDTIKTVISNKKEWGEIMSLLSKIDAKLSEKKECPAAAKKAARKPARNAK